MTTLPPPDPSTPLTYHGKRDGRDGKRGRRKRKNGSGADNFGSHKTEGPATLERLLPDGP